MEKLVKMAPVISICVNDVWLFLHTMCHVLKNICFAQNAQDDSLCLNILNCYIMWCVTKLKTCVNYSQEFQGGTEPLYRRA